jgi:hypothetical protein
VVIEADGIPFVAEAHRRDLVPGLRIEVQRVLGREGIVAYNLGLDRSAC